MLLKASVMKSNVMMLKKSVKDNKFLRLCSSFLCAYVQKRGDFIFIKIYDMNENKCLCKLNYETC